VKETVLQRSGNRTTRRSPDWFEGISAGWRRSRGARDLVCKLHSCGSMAHPSRNSRPNAVFGCETKWCILMDLPRADVQLLYLGAAVVPRLLSPDLPHACCDTAIRRQKTRTIVPHFYLEVVIFLFHGRNSGQRRDQERNATGWSESVSCCKSRAGTHLHVSDRTWQCLSWLRTAYIPAGLLIRPERIVGRRTGICLRNKPWS
jgi:hypothetical protein